MANESERQLNQLHPGVYSSINSSDDVYSIADGVITLLAADVFEKGEDGVLKFVSTPEEFKFYYGDPNYDRYGQQGYNIVNFLQSGGQAYVMRILPDDATYSHAVINVQTKINRKGKKIHLVDTNKDVYIDDVKIRPTGAFIKKNNINKKIMLSELTKLRNSENTIDGYENNFIFMVYPSGRGEAYNKLGIRIYTNQSFESIQNSRVYNFEVLNYNDRNEETLIEGPFYVTFEKDSLDSNGESMFIEDVVNRYSKYLNVSFNNDAYNRVCSIINPNVPTGKLDILTGKNIIDTDGQPVTFYCKETQREEATNISLQKYNAAGYLVTNNDEPVLNIPDPNDSVEQALIDLDNDTREEAYNRSVNLVEYMKQAFPGLLDTGFNTFKLNLAKIIADTKDVTNATGQIPDFIKNNLDEAKDGSMMNTFKSLKDAYGNNHNVDTLTNLSNQSSLILSTIKTNLLNLGNRVASMYKLSQHGTTGSGANYEQYLSDLDNILMGIARKDKITIFTVQHESKITKIINDISNYQLGLYEGTDIEGIGYILNNLEEEIKYVYENLLPVAFNSYESVPTEISQKFDKNHPDSITAKYNKILQMYQDIKDGYIVDSTNLPSYRTQIYSIANAECSDLINVIDGITYQTLSTLVTEIVTNIKQKWLKDIAALANDIGTMITVQGTYNEDAIRQNARQNINTADGGLVTVKSKFFNTRLLDFTSPIKLLLGSDGSFTYDVNNLPARQKAIKNYLIKAFNGTINPQISDTKVYPADIILDARYPNEVKTAIANFARNTRKDLQFFTDTAGTQFPVSPEDVLNWKRQNFNVTSEFVSSFSQDETYYDEYTGKNIRFTTTYALASKLPLHASKYGMHYPIAGPRRGIIDGFSAISWYPNTAYKEKLYNAHINYLQYDNGVTTLGSQSTTKTGAGALTMINNMFTLLKMKRGAEQLCRNYIFEFNDDETKNSLYTALNNYLSVYTTNRSCESVTATISASDYDKQQRILRVKIRIKFTGIIERIALDFDVA